MNKTASNKTGLKPDLNKWEIIEELKKQKPVLRERFNIVKIAYIESNSFRFCDDHINLMVRFDGYSGWYAYAGSELYLEDIFGIQVDMVTEDGVRYGLDPHVPMELTYV